MYIHVKVVADSKKEEIIYEKENYLKIYVKEPRERNLANTRVLEMLRELYPSAKQIRIINGHQSPSKLISVDME
jgi:uncharacterized protein YggU (UPF0235/DUF167 family)